VARTDHRPAGGCFAKRDPVDALHERDGVTVRAASVTNVPAGAGSVESKVKNYPQAIRSSAAALPRRRRKLRYRAKVAGRTLPDTSPEGGLVTAEENKALVQRWYDGVGRGEAAASAAVVSADYRMNGQPLGPQGAQQVTAMILDAFPDWRITVHDLLADGDLVAARLTYSGTHRGVWKGRGPVHGLPPTGRTFAMTSHEFYRISDGKIVELWVQSDMASLAEQLTAAQAQ
jgi:predicted ester cyclase